MSRKFIVVATLVLAGFVTSSAPAHAGSFIGKDGLPTDVFQREPANPVVDVECIARRATADAKMARTIARCDRVARRASDPFEQDACRNKAVKKDLRVTKGLTCGVTGGGKGGGGGVIYQYTCSGLMCSCVGDADCNDMYTNANCGDVTSCDTSGPEPACWCLKSLG
jgi:hypothetical protein